LGSVLSITKSTGDAKYKRRIKMTDSQLINLIASIWVLNGGDAEGLDYCYGRLKEEIKKMEDKGD
jgi:hypothetical protein